MVQTHSLDACHSLRIVYFLSLNIYQSIFGKTIIFIIFICELGINLCIVHVDRSTTRVAKNKTILSKGISLNKSK